LSFHKFIPAFYANFDAEDANKKLPNEIRRILNPLAATLEVIGDVSRRCVFVVLALESKAVDIRL
jgi:hypothetical protein